MALFVDLDDEDAEPPQVQVGKPVWPGIAPLRPALGASEDRMAPQREPVCSQGDATPRAPTELARRSPVAIALGCYPIIMAISSSIDLNTLDNLSKTCHQVRQSLLQYRKMLLISTLHCCNEDLAVDPDEALRYRARAGNWFYMQDTGRTGSNGKVRVCARDLVSECRRCGTVVCRNCAIKPPAPIVLRDRHRRLCLPCTKAPLARLAKPPLPLNTQISSDDMRRAICVCDSEGVWLCQPCGRSVRSDDHDYRGIWKWRTQYGEVLGGLGTGIGEGDRGVICGRESECIASREREQETDCDAADAREAESGFSYLLSGGSPRPPSTSSQQSITPPTTSWGTASATGSFSSLHSDDALRTPSPASALGPGYARHEIEGIGGVVKRKLVRMVRVGGCVPEWADEMAAGEILGREVKGRARSWCGWCWRVIPGRKDYEAERQPGSTNGTST